MAYQGLTNHTRYAADLALLADEAGRDVLLVLVKATYQILDRHQLAMADPQIPIDMAGEYYGEPGQTSLKYAPEANFAKQATDVTLIGHAHAPNGRPVTQLDVSLNVGPLSKTVRVFGDRHWISRQHRWRATTWEIAPPQPFTTLPLIYEHAFGGQDTSPENERDHACEARNLLGAGLIATNTRRTEIPLPNLEDPRQLIQTPQDRPAPAGFGPISPDWQPRLGHAGTYDDAWQANRMPLLPNDFDRRFFNAAHPDLIADGFLRGDESIAIVNASPRGPLEFTLPGHQPAINVTLANEPPQTLDSTLDSIIINTDDHTVQLLWRGSLDIHQRMYDLERIEIKLRHLAARPTPAAA